MTETVKKKRSVFASLRIRSLGGFAFLLLVIALIVGGTSAVINWMTDSNRMPLKQLVVQGNLHYLTTNDVRQTILHMGHLGTFLTQNVDQIQTALDTMPWVAQASVRKEWPDVIKVFLVEHVPAAIWNGQYIVDKKGDVFKAPAEQVTDLHLVGLYGPEGTSSLMLTTLHELQGILNQGNFHIATLTLNEWHSWQLQLTNGIQLELGQDDINQRLERFTWLYPQFIKQDKPIAYVDLRYSNGAAVGWKSASNNNKSMR